MTTNWNTLSYARLQAELKKRDLNAKGKRSELITLLVQYEKEQEDKLLAEAEDMEQEVEPTKSEADKDKKTNGIKKDTDERMETSEKEDSNTEKNQAKGIDEKSKDDKTKGDQNKSKDEDTNGKDDDLPADYSRTATGFILALEDDTKIVLPSKETLKYDILGHDLPRTVVVFPITIDDMMSEALREYIDGCVHFKIVFYERAHSNQKSETGYIQFVWDSVREAEEQTECLAELKEGIQALHVKDKKTIESVSNLPGESVVKEDVMKRLIYIGNLPQDVNEQALEALFPDASRLLVIRNEDGLFKGYALAEMENDDACERATKMYMNVEFGGKNLVVLRAWQKIPKGLLDCTSREELLETVKTCNIELKKNPTAKQLKKIDHDLNQAKQRLSKDVELRKEMGLCVPPDVARFDEEEEKRKEEEAKKLRKEVGKSAGTKKQFQPRKVYPASSKGPRGRERGWEPVQPERPMGNHGFRGKPGGFGPNEMSNQPPAQLADAFEMIDNIRDMLQNDPSGPAGDHFSPRNPRGGDNLMSFGGRNENLMGRRSAMDMGGDSYGMRQEPISRGGNLLDRDRLGSGMQTGRRYSQEFDSYSTSRGSSFGGNTSNSLLSQPRGGSFGGNTSDSFLSQPRGGSFGGNASDSFLSQTRGGSFGGNTSNSFLSKPRGASYGGNTSDSLLSQPRGGSFGGKTSNTLSQTTAYAHLSYKGTGNQFGGDSQYGGASSIGLGGGTSMRSGMLRNTGDSRGFGANMLSTKRPMDDDYSGFGSAKRGPGNFLSQKRW